MIHRPATIHAVPMDEHPDEPHVFVARDPWASSIALYLSGLDRADSPEERCERLYRWSLDDVAPEPFAPVEVLLR